MAEVLFVTTNYWPEPTGIAIYTTDLAESMSEAGHSVAVLTSLPHYPWWRTPSKFTNLIEGKTERNGVRLIRVQHFIPPKMNAILRIRFEVSLWWNLRKVSKSFKSNEFDLVIACIPTVASGFVGKKVAKELGISFGLIVQDLSGAGAKQSGLRGGVTISKIAHEFEGYVLRSANSLVVVSPAMKDAIAKYCAPTVQIAEIANYSAKAITRVDMTSARTKFGWALEDFIVLHSGNMGAKQDLVNVIQASEKLKNSSKIKIYLVGHGNQERKLKAMCQNKKNILIIPAVSEEEYSSLLAAADLLLVNERPTQIDMSLPSKLTSYLFSNRPVIGAVPKYGATWNFLDGIAELVEAGNPIKLAQKIEELSKNPKRLKELSDLGYKFAKENLDAEKGRQKYLVWVNELLKMKTS